MTRHSKNNTTRPFFTYEERRQLGYGTQKQRLGSESMRPFDACCLCLQPSVTPTLTIHGYIYCKECILENALSQKKHYKSLLKEYEISLKKKQDEEALQKQQKQSKEIESFEKMVDGLPSSTNQNAGSAQQQKRGSFWTNTLDSHVGNSNIAKPDNKIYDPMCKKPFRTKELVTLQFREVENKTNEKESIDYHNRFICGCCYKTLTNATKGAHCLVECGHVLCATCFDSFVKPLLKDAKSLKKKPQPSTTSSGDSSDQKKETPAQCVECGKRILRKPIPIQVAGTGFSQEGKANEAVKYTPQLGFA